MAAYFFLSPRSSKSASTTSPSLGPDAVRASPPGAPPGCGACPCDSRYMISASLWEARVRVSWARFIRSTSSLFSASRAAASASSTALRRRDADEVEPAERPVVARHLALALEDVDFHRRLAVRGGGEDLALLRRDRRVPRDQHRGHAAERLDSQREGRHVEQQEILDLAREHRRLDGRAHRHDLVRVDALVGLPAEELLHDLLNLRHAGLSTDEDHFLDVLRRDAGVLHRLSARPGRALDEIGDEGLELRPGEGEHEVLRPARVGRDERQVDLGLQRRRQLALGLLGSLLQALHGHAILAEVDPVLLFELLADPVDDALIEIVAAEVRVAVGRLHLEDALADLEDRDVEGPATEVVDGDRLVLLLVHSVG